MRYRYFKCITNGAKNSFPDHRKHEDEDLEVKLYPRVNFCNFLEKNSTINAICMTFRMFSENFKRTNFLKFGSV